MDNGSEHILHRLRLLFLDKDDRQMQYIPHHNGRGDTACLYRHDFIYIGIPETVYKFFSHLVKQHRVHLMVDKTVDLQDSSRITSAVLQNTLFK